jgi:hypothetical protein
MVRNKASLLKISRIYDIMGNIEDRGGAYAALLIM